MTISFEELPNEILLLIFEYLDDRSLCNVSLVDHALWHVSNDASFWRRRCVHRLHCRPLDSGSLVRSWKQHYLIMAAIARAAEPGFLQSAPHGLEKWPVGSLSASCKEQQIEIEMALVEHGAVLVSDTDTEGCTLLHQACAAGLGDSAKPLVQCLLAHRADTRSRDYIHWTPLHYCVSSKDASRLVAQLLLDHGARIGARDYSLANPIQTAEEFGQSEIAAWLREVYLRRVESQDEDDQDDELEDDTTEREVDLT